MLTVTDELFEAGDAGVDASFYQAGVGISDNSGERPWQ